MKLCVIIPVYNEEAHLAQTLQSLVDQTIIPNKIVIVNDNSTDNTQQIIDTFSKLYPFISSVYNTSSENHSPGSKVVQAFYEGLTTLDEEYDLIGKFDGDIVLPRNYFEKMTRIFSSDSSIGIASGNLYIETNDGWKFENISSRTKTRGPIKLYRTSCFHAIGGLKASIGWDTVDELLAKYHGWTVQTDPSLHVKHLKPTGANYSVDAAAKQGIAFYKMRYGWALTHIASAKLAWKKKRFSFYINAIKGFRKARQQKIPYIVSEAEGAFIRMLRWKNIKRKFF
ncbi:glycosyltransferase family A protein [Altibacter sp.]|uniref:glycosyltransferase n=1 Tax=Altibacter sp. TaxID=2024823 RepID=UPI000C8AA4A4|nr:glycosyltransferase family A protein [Altibacter sp.]MAP53420.1 glycosyl transferase family 2 [Altibacter sp.]